MRNKSKLAVVLLVCYSLVVISGVTLYGCRKKANPALESANRLIESLDEIEKALPAEETIDGIERALSKPSGSNEAKTQVQKQGK